MNWYFSADLFHLVANGMQEAKLGCVCIPWAVFLVRLVILIKPRTHSHHLVMAEIQAEGYKMFYLSIHIFL